MSYNEKKVINSSNEPHCGMGIIQSSSSSVAYVPQQLMLRQSKTVCITYCSYMRIVYIYISTVCEQIVACTAWRIYCNMIVDLQNPKSIGQVEKIKSIKKFHPRVVGQVLSSKIPLKYHIALKFEMGMPCSGISTKIDTHWVSWKYVVSSVY